MQMYHKRKDYLEGILQAEASKLSNQARFILEKCDGTIVIENRKKKDMIAELIRREYASDPVMVWKLSQNREEVLVSTAPLIQTNTCNDAFKFNCSATLGRSSK